MFQDVESRTVSLSLSIAARDGISEILKSHCGAGAGVNNIPLDRCSGEGIVVFNTPAQTLTP